MGTATFISSNKECLLNGLLLLQNFELIHELVGPLKSDKASKTYHLPETLPLAVGSQKTSMCIELTFFFLQFKTALSLGYLELHKQEKIGKYRAIY